MLPSPLYMASFGTGFKRAWIRIRSIKKLGSGFKSRLNTWIKIFGSLFFLLIFINLDAKLGGPKKYN